MTVQKVEIGLDYCSLYISGEEDFEVPIFDEQGIIATKACINVSALPWNDGDTTITLGRFDELPEQTTELCFDGFLDTPNHYVLLSDASNPLILTIDVPGETTRIRVWVNYRLNPDDIVVAVG